MRDETYCFVSDVKDRKRTAAGAKYKVRGGGRSVKLPADYLTKKEVAKLSGTVSTYQMSKPAVWREFKAWPEDIKREYPYRLISRYDANDTEYARAKLDEKLRQIFGDDFHPWEVRYSP